MNNFFSEDIPLELLDCQIEGCSCDPSSSCLSDICNCMKRSIFNFNNNGLNCSPESIRAPIFECNSNCKCSLHCMNRLVQLSNRLQESVIIKSFDECKGRGLFAKCDISKYTWICNYEGEYITKEESVKRENIYKSHGKHNYVLNFLIAFGERKSLICIDGGHLARDEDAELPWSAYVNHSCLPNMHIVPVFVDNPNFPILGFFAVRDISTAEELTLSYCQDNDAMTALSDTPCSCGSNNCRGFLPRCSAIDDEVD